jgi:outer membrane protein TolC
MPYRFKVKSVYWLLAGLFAVLLVSSCTTPLEYKDQADKEVYKIIDGKWQPSFGQKANYKIGDVSPSPNDIRFDVNKPPVGILTLARAVAIATANSREYQAQKDSLYLSALDLTLERHKFARQWFATVDGAYSNNGSGEAAGESLSADTGTSGVGFSQLLADGATISTSIAIDWARFLTGDPRESLGSVFSASITQPLLRGAGRKIAQENLTQAERKVLYQIRSFNRYRKTFVVSVITDYYRVLQQKDAVVNAFNSYQRKIELKERLQMESDVGKTPRFQVDQAEQSELTEKDNYNRAQQGYQQALDQFKISLALPVDAKVELDPNELKALYDIGIQQPNYTLSVAVETALLNRLDLATAFDNVDDAHRKIMVAIDSLGAGLNLTAGMSAGSEPPTNFDKLMFNEGNYSLGLSADLPLDRKSERNSYRTALITLQQRQRDYDDAKSKVELDVRNSYRRLLQEADSYITQKKSLDLAQKRVDISDLLWQTGRASTRDILESQDALLSAQNSLTAALVDHTIAKLTFFMDIDVLQVKPDGMWEQTKQ